MIFFENGLIRPVFARLVAEQRAAFIKQRLKRCGGVPPWPTAHWLPRVRSSQRRLAAGRYAIVAKL